MNHIRRSRPAVATVAATAAVTIMLVTTTASPPQPKAVGPSPRISIEAVQLVVLPAALKTASTKTAGAGVVANDLADSVYAIPQAITAWIGAGIFAGFIFGGLLAGSLVSQIPLIGPALLPIVPIAAVIGALVGIPIGVVVGTFNAIQNAVSSPVRAPSAASARPAISSKTVTTPHRSTKSGTQSNRHTAKPVAPAKTSAAQQSSSAPRAGSGRAHAVTSNRAARH